MKIQKILEVQKKLWTDSNIGFFGLTPRNWTIMKKESIEEALFEDTAKYWNSEKPCEMAELILNDTISRDSKNMTDKGFKLEYNNISECIDVKGYYKKLDGPEELKVISSIPAPFPDLTWGINGTRWTPRVTALRDYEQIYKDENKEIIRSRFWDYNLETKEFKIRQRRIKNKLVDIDPFEELTGRSVALLEAALGEELTRDNFEEALHKIPRFHYSSLFNYKFSHLETFFNIVRDPSKFANPMKNIPLAVNRTFLQQADDSWEKTGHLVIASSPIYSLENFRTIVYSPVRQRGAKRVFVPSFNFTQTKGFFDAFKTSTSSSAGRQRLLLDDVTVKNDMLYYIDEDGIERNMFHAVFNKPNGDGISSISSSMFCNNNEPKRIMMTSKLSAQAVSVDGKADDFTNRVPARVVFAEYDGWTYADSIIISESFAKKLNHHAVDVVTLNTKDPEIHDLVSRITETDGYELTLDDLELIYPHVSICILKSYKNVKITSFENLSEIRVKIILEYDIPFSLGDKITNLHGSKGVVGKILPDNEMPYLENDIGEFKAGPFEVIISGYSVLRRGSLGQIFEAWATASGIEFEPGKDFAKLAMEKYAEEMKEFSRKSLVTFQGVTRIKPVGIIDIIRLHHHATTKISLSYIKPNSNKMLSFGEQEKLNLAARGAFDILRELSLRSTHKHVNAVYEINKMRKTRNLPRDLQVSSKFARLLKSIGFNLSLENQDLVKSDRSIQEKHLEEAYEEILNLHSTDRNLEEIFDAIDEEFGRYLERMGKEQTDED